jgi:malonyl-CoA/methylmalonyl-CoA synthetase
MTEVGMALSCGLDSVDRVDGSVGWPLPSVEVRLVDVDSKEVIAEGEEVDRDGRERQGELQLRGPTIFSGYWRNPKATHDEFVPDDLGGPSWFKTGDMATRKTFEGAGNGPERWTRGPLYFIRGRKSVDIIKSGGEKISALEIETQLLSLPQVAEAAVVGIPSEVWGQRIAAVIVLDPVHANSGKVRKQWGAMDMRRALRDRLANYKIPHELKIIGDIPKNAMGKGECGHGFGTSGSHAVLTMSPSQQETACFGPFWRCGITIIDCFAASGRSLPCCSLRISSHSGVS